MALLFVTMPFVVRAVQPVLLELDQDMEEAAASLGAGRFTTFRRIILPNILPAILSGVALAFARACGEYGSLVLFTGNLPFKTEVASVYIFGRLQSGDTAGAAAVSTVLLGISLLTLLLIGAFRRWRTKPTMSRYSFAVRTLGYVAVLLGLPVGLIFYRTFEHGVGTAWAAVTTEGAKHALLLTLEIAAIAVPANTLFGVGLAIVLVRTRFPGSGFVNALVDVPLAMSPIVVGIALFLLYGRGGWLSGIADHGIVLFSVPGMVLASIFVSLPFVVREVVPVLREIGTEQEQAASTLGAARSRRSGASRCRRSAGRSPTASC